jgi:predicted transposase YbfD/YdcC
MPDQELGYVRYFAELPDPQSDRTKRHSLHDILGVTLCAVICGADTFEEIERFGQARLDALRQFLPLPNGIPSHDTFNRVLAALDRKTFAACFGRWMADLCEVKGLKPIAVDGKACRPADGDTFTGCLHLVSAWATENGLILGQEAVADGSHEITAIPELLKALDLKKSLVTTDAAGCQTEIVGQIRSQGGDYLIAVKGNQPELLAAVGAVVERACEAEFAGCSPSESVKSGPGRTEERYVTVIPKPEGIPEAWTDVRGVVVVHRERVVRGKSPTHTTHYYITSSRAGAGTMAERVRGALGGGERAARVSGREFRRGRQPHTGHERGGQLGDGAASGRLTAQAGPEAGKHQGEATHRRLGPRLPPPSAQRIQGKLDAFALAVVSATSCI